MPQCMKCKEFFPPDFCDDIQPGNLHMCHFCKKGNNSVFSGDIMYTKSEVIHDYKVFIAELAASSNVKEKITNLTVEGAVKRLKQ